MNSAWDLTAKKKKKKKTKDQRDDGDDDSSSNNVIFQSPWAITKQVKKPVDPADAIMKNRLKSAKATGADADADADAGTGADKKTKKRRKIATVAEEEGPGGTKKNQSNQTRQQSSHHCIHPHPLPNPAGHSTIQSLDLPSLCLPAPSSCYSRRFAAHYQ
jgi:hypothetical protein